MNLKITGYVHGYDFNCATDFIRLESDEILPLAEQSLLQVTETKQVTDFADGPSFPVVVRTFPRKVLDVFYVKEDNERSTQPTRYQMMELEVNPETGIPLLFSLKTFMNTWSDPYELRVCYDDQWTCSCTGKDLVTSADDWSLSSYICKDGTAYQYAHYEPKDGSKNLIVWLHGIGEGGTENTDARVPLLANKADILKREEFQKVIGKANILVPQCPTYWMDANGNGDNLNHGRIEADGTSFYKDSLLELIRNYKDKTGSEKIVLAGCSNGGYMTVLLGMQAPELFNGYVPICEAMPDRLITDEQVDLLVHEKMYFVYSRDDQTVAPELHEEPLLKRLRAKNAGDIHVSVTEHVEDRTGRYFMKDSDHPYRYAGQWSWIRFFNNECDADGLSAWDFIRICLK